VCLERQCSKSGLAGEIVDGDVESRKFSEAELSSLFNPDFQSASNFHDRMGCKCCGDGQSKPDANGMLHLRCGCAALNKADGCLARAAKTTGLIPTVFTKVTNAHKGFDVEPQVKDEATTE